MIKFNLKLKIFKMLHDSNEKLIEIIKKNKQFLVSRIGMGPENRTNYKIF